MGRLTTGRLLVAGARFFSTVLSPLLMPTYGALLVLWTSVLCLLPNGTRVMVLVMVLGITCVLPMIMIGILHHYGIISDKRLEDPRERTIPYAFAVLCYLGAAAYLQHIHSPLWFVMSQLGGALGCFAILVINRWWKISAHATGIGGVVALIYQIHVLGLSAFNLLWVFVVTILLAGILCTSRLLLKRHTVLQVLAGFAVGFACVDLLMKFFG